MLKVTKKYVVLSRKVDFCSDRREWFLGQKRLAKEVFIKIFMLYLNYKGCR